jgi:hypothetical protein
VIRFRLRAPGQVELVVRQSGPACAVVGRKYLRGHAGVNRVRFEGRYRGRALPPGRYTITVVVVRAGKRTPVGTVAVEIVPDGRRLTRAERTAPVNAGCSGSITQSAGTSLLADLAAPLVANGARGDPPHAGSKGLPRPVTLGPSFTPPKLPGTAGGGGGIDWALMLLYAGIALAVGVLIVHFARFFRDLRTP